jgi:L-ascorbate metabolism protein UlaG (beta-lactamase superfamily)
MKTFIENITWFGQSSIRIRFENKTVYFDPYNLKQKDSADIIFITHGHQDHLSPKDLHLIVTSKTKIYATSDLCKTLTDSGFTNLHEVKIGDRINIEGFETEVVPAYNIKKPQFHPKSNGWVGYVVDFKGTKVYHPGDTERIPEMKNIKCDIAFMPLGQTYTMESVEDAADAVLDVQAKFAIPFHFGMYEGKKDDALKFKELLNGKVDVVIKEM